MSKRLPVLLPLLVSCLAIGCRSENDRNREAIIAVLRSDRDLAMTRTASMQSSKTIAELASTIEQYCAGMSQIDLSSCPPEFRVAFRRHIEAWRGAIGVINQFPDGLFQQVLMGFLNGLAGEIDGGASRLRGEINSADDRIRATYREAEEIALQYGAAL